MVSEAGVATRAAPSIVTAATLVKIVSSLTHPLLQQPPRTLPEVQAIQRHKHHPDKHNSNSSRCREVTLASEIASKNGSKGLYSNANILTSTPLSCLSYLASISAEFLLTCAFVFL